jgi:hypothetical protein
MVASQFDLFGGKEVVWEQGVRADDDVDDVDVTEVESPEVSVPHRWSCECGLVLVSSP